MGKAGREVVKGNVQEIIDELNKALAAELHAAYSYLLLSKMVSGPHSEDIAEFFEETAQDEWRHVGVMIERILSLGGKPLARPALAEQYTYVPYKEPPASAANWRQMVLDSLEGERAAIRFYQALYERTQHTDPVTARLAQEALADEVSDEDDLERFLGE